MYLVDFIYVLIYSTYIQYSRLQKTSKTAVLGKKSSTRALGD